MTADRGAKACARCRVVKSVDEYHRQPSGPLGRHSYCKPCANAEQRRSRVHNVTPEKKARWQLAARYGLTPADVARMREEQGGLCGICAKLMARACVDHDHATGRVRGLLCHGCNIKLAAIEQADYRTAAIAYLKHHSADAKQ